MIDQKELTIRLNHVILIDGFRQLSMSKLATAANVSRAKLYLCFKNKDEIVAAVVDRHFRFIAEHPVPKHFTPATFLPIWLDSLLLMGATTDKFKADLQQVYPDLYQRFEQAYQTYFEQLKSYVAQGQNAGFLVADFSAEFVIFQAQTLVSAVLTQVRQQKLTLTAAEHYMSAIFDLQLTGLVTPAARDQLQLTNVTGFMATILREFRATYAQIASH
ncbi:TetR/AcrR family transcriptional regulator [Levilactobacillus brevis]|uniref:TetR/AcrR family transcriptional regulator n=1 Tax=Levilactobacillus brevis TaxID=1580 RepID=UPI003D16B3B4